MFFKADESCPAHARAPVAEWILIGASTVLELTFVWQKEPSEEKMTAEVEHAINEQTKEEDLQVSQRSPIGPGLGCNGSGERLAVVGGSTPSAALSLSRRSLRSLTSAEAAPSNTVRGSCNLLFFMQQTTSLPAVHPSLERTEESKDFAPSICILLQNHKPF